MTVRFGSHAGRIPAALWLGILIAASAAVRFLVARGYPAPWILDDELIFIDSARSLVGSLVDSTRGANGAGLYFVYPALISPAFALFDDPSSAYMTAKLINCVLMSSAAVPAYLIARRVLERGPSLLVALLTLAVPSMIYTAAIMTENAFYPAFLWCSLAILRVLERPSTGRQLLALASIAVAFLIRNQAIALVPALGLALLSRALFDARRGEADTGPAERPTESLWRRLAAYRTTWVALASPPLALAAAWAFRPDLLRRLAGRNRFVFDLSNEVYLGFLGRLPRTVISHLADLDLYVGVLPFVALMLLAVRVFRERREDRSLAAFTWVALWTTACNLLMVATFLALVDQPRIADRNLFVVAPLFFVALCRWAEDASKDRRQIVAACVLAGVLPVLIDFAGIRRELIVADSLALVAAAKLKLVLGLGTAFGPLLAAAAVAVSCALFLPHRFSRSLPLAALAFLVAIHAPVVRATSKESDLALREGVPPEAPQWIDGAVGDGARVTALWHGVGSRHPYWQGTFFNRSVGRVLAFYGPGDRRCSAAKARDRGLDRLPLPELRLDPATGILLDAEGTPLVFDKVLTHSALELDAEVIARDDLRAMVLYDANGPVRVLARTTGVGGDGWTARRFAHTVIDGGAGVLELDLHSAPDVHSEPQTLVASIDGVEVARTVLTPGEYREFAVPYPESHGSWCRIDFEVSRTGAAARVAGRRDRRELGLVCTRLRRHARPEVAEVFLAGVEPDGWSRERFEVRVAHSVPGDLFLSFWAEVDNGLGLQRVAGARGGVPIACGEVHPGEQRFVRVPLGPESGEFTTLDFEVSPPFVPDDAFGTGDRRSLGVLPGPFVFLAPGELEYALEGVHHDRWTGPRFAFRVEPALAGEVTLHLATNGKIFPQGQTVVGRIGESEVLRVELAADEERAVTVELPTGCAGSRPLELEVRPTTASPGAIPTGDPRELGILLRGIAFRQLDPCRSGDLPAVGRNR